MPAKRKPVRKKRKPLKRSSPARRAAILADAKVNRLTGKEVAKKYGISAAIYYLWRRQIGAKWYGVGNRTSWKTRRGESGGVALGRIVRQVIQEEMESLLRRLGPPRRR